MTSAAKRKAFRSAGPQFHRRDAVVASVVDPEKTISLAKPGAGTCVSKDLVLAAKCRQNIRRESARNSVMTSRSSNTGSATPHKPSASPDDALKPSEVASRLKVSLSWLAKARMRGDGPPYFPVGRGDIPRPFLSIGYGRGSACRPASESSTGTRVLVAHASMCRGSRRSRE
jgi:hypothetical protein